MSNRIINLYAVYDRSAEAFGPLFSGETDGIAIRGFIDAITRPEQSSDISNHPDHFELFFMGTYDRSEGVLSSADPARKPIFMGTQASVSKSA